MVRGIWSTGSVTDSRTGAEVRFGRGESTQEGGWSMARGIWINGLCRGRFARTGTDVRFGWWRVHAGGMFGKRIAILTAVSIVVSCPHGKG